MIRLRKKSDRAKRGLLRQAGFTLLEFTVSLGFTTALGGLVLASSFIALRTDTEGGARADVAVETVRATRWLIRGGHRADSTDLC